LLLPLALTGIATAESLAAWLPRCFFFQKTGLLCPGCGATRAALALDRGDIIEALHANLILTAGIFLGGGWLFLAAMRQRFPQFSWLRPFRFYLAFLWGALAVVAFFWLLRNLPGFEWLRPP
jgi:hypothetical protein